MEPRVDPNLRWWIASALPVVCIAATSAFAQGKLKTERFDRDPGWEGLNNRVARVVKIRQDFGFRDGKIGGLITIAGEPACYARKLSPKTFDDELTASGTLICRKGSGMAMFGFFNSDTLNEWRTRNSIVIRIIGRNDTFEAHAEYDTQRWRAGSRQFTANTPGQTTTTFASGDTVHRWSLKYDPRGNNGGGTVELTVDEHSMITELNPGHKLDGATFNRFGMLNVMKHADDPLELWIGELTINGEKQDLSNDPKWEEFQNRREYETRDDRPYSDYGFSPTHHAGGTASGELGGLIFRGDVRLPDGLNCFGDRIELLTLDKPLKASGRIVFRRGVQDSSTLIGFFHSPDSVTINPDSPRTPRSWFDYLPKSFFGVAIKGPTREGYFFHPTYRLNGDDGGGNPGNAIANCPRLNPDRIARDWSFEYSPTAADGKGQITVTLDGQSATLDLLPGHKTAGARFNRFGIVSNWVDGNGQVVYLDDLIYTASQE
jgi:hypothetical protein